MRDFSNLIERGDPDSIRDAYDLIHRHERMEGIPPDALPVTGPDIRMNLDWDRLERIALAPSPRAWVERQLAARSAALTACCAGLAMVLSFFVLSFAISWSQLKWMSEPALVMRPLAAMVVASVCALCAVVIATSALHVMSLVSKLVSFPKVRWSGLPASVAGMCAVLVCFWAVSRFPLAAPTLRTSHVTAMRATYPLAAEVSLDPLALPKKSSAQLAALESQRVQRYITPEVKVRAAVAALRMSGGLRLYSNGKPLAETDPVWSSTADQVQQKLVKTLTPVIGNDSQRATESSTAWVMRLSNRIREDDSDSDLSIDSGARTLKYTVMAVQGPISAEMSLRDISKNMTAVSEIPHSTLMSASVR